MKPKPPAANRILENYIKTAAAEEKRGDPRYEKVILKMALRFEHEVNKAQRGRFYRAAVLWRRLTGWVPFPRHRRQRP